MNKTFITCVVVVILMASFVITYTQQRANRPTQHSGKTLTVAAEQISIDLAVCAPDSNTFYWSLGSVFVEVKGKRGDKCNFHFGLELEGGGSTYECTIPISLSEARILETKHRDPNPAEYGIRTDINYSFDRLQYCVTSS